MSVTD